MKHSLGLEIKLALVLPDSLTLSAELVKLFPWVVVNAQLVILDSLTSPTELVGSVAIKLYNWFYQIL